MNKFTKKLIPYKAFSSFLLCIFIYAFYVFSIIGEISETEEIDLNAMRIIALVGLGIFLVVYLCMLVYYYLYQRTSGYEFTDKGIIATRGVLFKKKSFLEYHKIHTVNKKQGIIQKLFKISYLLIDSGSTNTAHSAEILLIETDEMVEKLMKDIKDRQKGNVGTASEEISEKENKESLYHLSSKSKFLNGFFNSIIMFFVMFFVFICMIGLSIFEEHIEESISTPINQIIAIFILVFIGATILSFGISVISSFFTYHDFALYKKEDALEIKYGLFVKNTNSFAFERIKAIKIRNSFFKRLFHYATIDIEVIGYGVASNDSNQNNSIRSVLIPLCRIDEVEPLIDKILGEEYKPIERSARSKSYFSLFSWRLLGTSIFFIVTLIVLVAIFASLNMTNGVIISSLSVLIVYLISLIFILIDSRIKFNFEGIGIQNNRVCVYHGGFNQVKTIFLSNKIIGVEDITTPLRKKHDIYSFVIHFRSNALTNTCFVECVDKRVKNELLDITRE